MNICEAVEKMKRQNKKYITTQEFKNTNFDFKIEPTNSPECCFVYLEKEIYKGWQPKLTDFLRNDWIICD